MNPMIKYRGGKSKEISHFISNMPENYNRYIEPFFGGGALYFYLEPQNAIINDVNIKLYSFYKQMKEEYPIARMQLDELQTVYEQNQKEYDAIKKQHPEDRVENKNEALYYKMRDMFNHKIKCEYLDAVVYFFINKTAYSGMIRYNAKGEYNVPFGRYKNFNTKLITDKHYELLNRTDIYNYDYSEIFKMAGNNDFIFLDPPYDTEFSEYAKNSFGKNDQMRLAEFLSKTEANFMLIIKATPYIYDLYKDKGFSIYSFDKKYMVNFQNRNDRNVKHLVITNYERSEQNV